MYTCKSTLLSKHCTYKKASYYKLCYMCIPVQKGIQKASTCTRTLRFWGPVSWPYHCCYRQQSNSQHKSAPWSHLAMWKKFKQCNNVYRCNNITLHVWVLTYNASTWLRCVVFCHTIDKVKRNLQSSSKHNYDVIMHAFALLDPTTHDLDISFRVGQCIPSSSLINYTCTYSSYTSYNCNMLFPIALDVALPAVGYCSRHSCW